MRFLINWSLLWLIFFVTFMTKKYHGLLLKRYPQSAVYVKDAPHCLWQLVLDIHSCLRMKSRSGNPMGHGIILHDPCLIGCQISIKTLGTHMIVVNICSLLMLCVTFTDLQNSVNAFDVYCAP